VIIFTWAVAYWMMERAKKGHVPFVRSLSALNAIDESIGRAVELGRPVHLTTGHGGKGMYTRAAGNHLAGLSILGYVAQKCAETECDLICSVGFAEMIPIAEDVISQGCVLAGNPGFFRPDMVRFHVDNWHTFALYTMAMIQDENVATNIMVGNLDCTTGAIIAAGGAAHGMMQIGGTRSSWGMATFIAFCDYVLIGEEMPIAGAMIAGDQESVASLVSSDVSKLLLVLIVLLGITMSQLGFDLSWLFV
jgi:hypothetical protein